MYNAGIIGIGSYVPEKIVTNFDLEKTLDTSDEWITTRTGIKERRIAYAETETSDLALAASQEAIAHAGLQPSEIDLILLSTSTGDYPSFPSTACILQKKLGISQIGALDISAACSGFTYAMVIAKQFIETGVYRHVLVVGAEKMSKIVNWEDRNTAILFGDGAGAVVMGRTPEGTGILSFDLGADGAGAEHLTAKEAIEMNGREVFKFATRQIPESIRQTLVSAHLTTDDLDLIVPHQANIRIIESASDRLKVPMDKFSVTVNQYGNTSAASIPLSLAHELKNGTLKKGNLVALTGFGGGLTWATLILKWGI